MADIEREGFAGRLGRYFIWPVNRGDTLLISYEHASGAASGEIWDLDKGGNDYEQVLVEALGIDWQRRRINYEPSAQSTIEVTLTRVDPGCGRFLDFG